MQDFKNFFIRLQTINIKINQRGGAGNTDISRQKIYDISHENPFLSSSFGNEMKELKELALTDILMLPREQVIFQVQRLGDIKDKFRMFWQNYSTSYVTDTYSTAFFDSLSIDDIFIAPSSNFLDQ